MTDVWERKIANDLIPLVDINGQLNDSLTSERNNYVLAQLAKKVAMKIWVSGLPNWFLQGLPEPVTIG